MNMLKALRPVAAVLAVAGAALGVTPAHALEVQQVRSRAGVEAWLAEDHTLPVVSLQFAFLGAGSAAEPAGRGGVASLAASLLGDGAGPYDEESFGTQLATRGIDLGFSAERDALVGGLQSTVEHLDSAVELLRLALTAPRLDARALERERASLLTTLARLETDPGHVANRQWWARAFAGHPYARAPLGTRDSVAAITRDDVRLFLERALARNRLVIGVAGAIDAQTLATLLDRVFAGLPETPARVARRAPLTLPGDVAVTRLPLPQSTVVFAQAGIARNDPDYYAALVMNHILGGGVLTSRLFHELREKRGLVYSVRTALEHHAETDLLSGWFATENARVKEAVTLVREQWRRLARGDVSEAEVDAAKAYLAGSLVLRLDGTAAVAAVLTEMQRRGLGIDESRQRAERIAALDIDDVRRVAGRLLDPEHLTFSVAGDPPAGVGLEPSVARAGTP